MKTGLSDSLPRRGRWIAGIVFITPVLAFLIATGLYVSALGRCLSVSLAPLVAQVIGPAMHREAKLGRFDAFSMPGRITLDRLVISNHATFAQDRGGHPFLDAHRLIIHYDLPAIVRDYKRAVEHIGDIDLIGGSVFIQRTTLASWNFSDLIPHREVREKAPYPGLIDVRNVSVYFQDRSASPQLRNNIVHLTRVNVAVDCRSLRQFKFSASGSSADRLFRSGAVSGVILRNPAGPALVSNDRGFRVRVRLRRGSAWYLATDFVPWLEPYIRVRSGLVDADVSVNAIGVARGRPVDVQGFVHVDGGSFDDVRRQILLRRATDVAGDVFFTTRQVTLSVSGAANGIPVAVNGVLFGFPKVDLGLRIDLPRVPVDRLHQSLTFIPALPAQLRIPQPAAAELTLTGDITDPTVRGAFRAPSAEVAGYEFRDVQAQVAYSRGLIAVPDLSGTPGNGGRFTSDALIDVRQKPIALVYRGRLQGVSLQSLLLTSAQRQQWGALSGLADVSFVAASGRPAPPSARPPTTLSDVNAPIGPIRAQLAVDISKGSIHGYSLASVSGRAQYVQGVGVTIPELTIKDAKGGAVLLHGSAPMIASAPPRLDLRINAARLQIGDLASLFGVQHVHGTGYFDGAISGPASNPQVAGRISLVDARLNDRAIDLANGYVRYHDGNVAIEGMTVQVDPTLARISGIVSGAMTRNPQFDLHVAVSRVPLSDVLEQLPATAVANQSDQNMKRILQTATGSIDGSVDFAGSLQSPQVRGDFTVAHATVDAYHFTDCLASFRYARNVIEVRQVRATWENAQFEAAGTYNLATRAIDASFTGNGLQAQNIARLISSDIAAAGSFAIAGSVHGNIRAPRILAQTVTDQMKIGGFTFDSVRAAGEYAGGVLSSTGVPIVVSLAGAKYTITSYSLNLDTKAVSVVATVEDQKLSVLLSRIESTSAIMNRLSTPLDKAIRELPQPLDGDVSVPKLAVSGTLDHPTITVAADIRNLNYGTEHLDDLSADFDYGSGKLTVRTLKAANKTASMSASGSIDLNGPINARIQGSNVDIGLLTGMLPVAVPVKGTISRIEIAATGETRSPRMAGFAQLSDIAYQSTSFDRIDTGQFSIADSRLTIKGLTMTKDEKLANGAVTEHVATVSGTVPFAWDDATGIPTPVFPTNIPMELRASIPRQSLSALKMFAPQLDSSLFNGQFQADVTMGGTLANKQLSGQIQIVDGLMQPPEFRTGLKNIQAEVDFSGATATIVRATADSTLRNGGNLTAGGTLTFSGAREEVRGTLADALLGGVSVNIDVKANAFQVSENKMAEYGNAGFSGRIDGVIHISEILTSPLASGKLTVADASVSLPNGQAQIRPAATVPAINPRFHVTVAIKQGARIESSEVRISSAGGSFTLLGSLAVPNLHGRLTIDKGTFNLPTASFRFLPGGTAEVSYSPSSPADVNGMTIMVNLQARTTMSIAQRTLATNPGLVGEVQVEPSILGTYAGSQRYTITATITGSLKSDGTGLNLQFESDPPLATSQILAALGGQSIQEIGGGALNSGVSSLFAQVLSNSLSQSVFGSFYEATGLDVNVDYNADLPLVVSVTRELFPRVNLTFIRLGTSRDASVVSSTYTTPQYQLLLGYNLKDRINLIISADDQYDYGIGLEDVFRF